MSIKRFLILLSFVLFAGKSVAQDDFTAIGVEFVHGSTCYLRGTPVNGGGFQVRYKKLYAGSTFLFANDEKSKIFTTSSTEIKDFKKAIKEKTGTEGWWFNGGFYLDLGYNINEHISVGGILGAQSNVYGVNYRVMDTTSGGVTYKVVTKQEDAKRALDVGLFGYAFIPLSRSDDFGLSIRGGWTNLSNLFFGVGFTFTISEML
jgi:hypothetical protein